MALRYKDLALQPEVALRRILGFSDTDVVAEIVSDALTFSSFENMKKLEMANQLIRPAEAGADKDPQKRKVRKGALGGYRSSLKEADINFIDEKLKLRLDPTLEIEY
jgi:hypothetical protein